MSCYLDFCRAARLLYFRNVNNSDDFFFSSTTLASQEKIIFGFNLFLIYKKEAKKGGRRKQIHILNHVLRVNLLLLGKGDHLFVFY